MGIDSFFLFNQKSLALQIVEGHLVWCMEQLQVTFLPTTYNLSGINEGIQSVARSRQQSKLESCDLMVSDVVGCYTRLCFEV